MDALASFTKAGHMAGPILDVDSTAYKVNSLMAVKKSGGDVRVVENLKHPPGKSFNEGIQKDKLTDWTVKMLTAAKFARWSGWQAEIPS